MIIEELTYHRYRSWRDFALLAYAAIAENVGFRQLHAWWRLRGLCDALLRRKADWLGNAAGQEGGSAFGMAAPSGTCRCPERGRAAG